MPNLALLIPDPDAVLALEAAELAGYLLEALANLSPNETSMNRYNFGLAHNFMGYPENRRAEMQRAWMEAWMWLEREGMLAPQPGQERDWMFVTRLGQRLRGRQNLDAYRKASALPRELLQPTVSQRVWPLFLRGEYDVAVFQAFKEVEVAIRAAGSFQSTDIGVPLARRAFDVTNGPLTDDQLPQAEKQAMSDLFAGSLGLFKNPGSHRHLLIQREEAVALILLANHLLRIIDSRGAPTP